ARTATSRALVRVRVSRGQPRVAHGERAIILDDDRVFRAHFFAHRTAYASLRIDEASDAPKGAIVQLEAIKGADVNAEVAPGAKLVDDLGLGPVGALANPLRRDAGGIFNALLGADVRTRAAVDADGRVDVMKLFIDPCDSFNGTHLNARRAPDAPFRDQVWHKIFRLRRRRAKS